MKVHFHLGYINKTACGILAYADKQVSGEYDTDRNTRIECSHRDKEVTCVNCQRVMRIGKHDITSRILAASRI